MTSLPLESIDLQSIDITKIKEFSLNGHKCDARVVSVYDGDSIKVIFVYDQKIYKWTCRLDGIDTPEIKSKNINEKELAIKARDALRNKILEKIVKIECKDFDKYGRLLVDILFDGYHINKWMIDENYAKPYFGGKKEEW